MPAKKIAALLAVVMLAFSACGCAKGGRFELERTVFSSGMVFSVSMAGSECETAAREMLDFLDEADRSFNCERADSMISRFNAMRPGERMEADEHFFTLLNAAKEMFALTDGAFNAAVTPLSRVWHVDVEGITRYCYGGEPAPPLPDYGEVEEAKKKCDLSRASCYLEDGAYYAEKNGDVVLDFGGLAKGYCTDRCRDIARSHGIGDALISLSGNVTLVGRRGGERWGVGVVDPRREESGEDYVCGFYSDGDEAIVTSGDYERRYFALTDSGELRVCHILDCRTGLPVGVERTAGGYRASESYVISATVICPSAMIADAYSTAAAVLGADRGAALLEAGGCRGLIFTSDKRFVQVGEFDMLTSRTRYLTDYTRS